MTNPLDLPFDTEEMLTGLRPWIETESPTFDGAAVNRMMDVAQHDLAVLGARTERIPSPMGLGDSLRAEMPHPARARGASCFWVIWTRFTPSAPWRACLTNAKAISATAPV
ncbi:hypothetical protein [Sulfitobacter faviae]|uniref:hypothetical protein n=1 Tax=Sulfitobacter faviae TaxID=1775881 RepID=UPI002454AA72|nr:hypothetical protein [Sulfitobacter faviae]